MALLEYYAEVQQTAEHPRVRIAILAEEEIRLLPRAEAEERLSVLLHQLRVRPEFTMYGFGTFASYVDPIPREQLFWLQHVRGSEPSLHPPSADP